MNKMNSLKYILHGCSLKPTHWIHCDYCHTICKTQTCGNCHLVFYCGIECQTNAWAEHKRFCSDLKSTRQLLERVGIRQSSDFGSVFVFIYIRRYITKKKHVRALQLCQVYMLNESNPAFMNKTETDDDMRRRMHWQVRWFASLCMIQAGIFDKARITMLEAHKYAVSHDKCHEMVDSQLAYALGGLLNIVLEQGSYDVTIFDDTLSKLKYSPRAQQIILMCQANVMETFDEKYMLLKRATALGPNAYVTNNLAVFKLTIHKTDTVARSILHTNVIRFGDEHPMFKNNLAVAVAVTDNSTSAIRMAQRLLAEASRLSTKHRLVGRNLLYVTQSLRSIKVGP